MKYNDWIYLKKNIIKKYFILKSMKNNSILNKLTTITKTKIERRIRKTQKKLKTLYIEYELLQFTKTILARQIL